MVGDDKNVVPEAAHAIEHARDDGDGDHDWPPGQWTLAAFETKLSNRLGEERLPRRTLPPGVRRNRK